MPCSKGTPHLRHDAVWLIVCNPTLSDTELAARIGTTPSAATTGAGC